MMFILISCQPEKKEDPIQEQIIELQKENSKVKEEKIDAQTQNSFLKGFISTGIIASLIIGTALGTKARHDSLQKKSLEDDFYSHEPKRGDEE